MTSVSGWDRGAASEGSEAAKEVQPIFQSFPSEMMRGPGV